MLPAFHQQASPYGLVERAAAGFHKALLLAPELAQPPYDTLIQTFEQYIPQAVQPLEVSNGGN